MNGLKPERDSLFLSAMRTSIHAAVGILQSILCYSELDTIQIGYQTVAASVQCSDFLVSIDYALVALSSSLYSN